MGGEELIENTVWLILEELEFILKAWSAKICIMKIRTEKGIVSLLKQTYERVKGVNMDYTKSNDNNNNKIIILITLLLALIQCNLLLSLTK